MGIKVERFGKRILTQDLRPGDLAICRIGGIGSFLIVRADILGPHRYDLFLAELGGNSAPKKQYPFVRPSSGAYVTIPGTFTARPLKGIAVPGDPGPGAITVDPEGRTFIRVDDDGDILYLALDTFSEGKPNADREYYPSWELVLLDGENETSVCVFPPKEPLLD